MQPPKNFERIIDQVRYRTKAATLLAGDDYWDGHNFERQGRNTFLYRTPNGRYFRVDLTQWQGEGDSLTPVSETEALNLFENELTEQRVSYAEAFPGVVVKDA
ncbi:MAG: hypothetical protein ROW48_07840 [Bellilinea sp.]|jgi:hypothetical protein